VPPFQQLNPPTHQSQEPLFVKFSASPACLGKFLTTNNLERTSSGSFADVPEKYGWSIDAGAAFYSHQSEHNTDTVAVVTGPDDLAVYVVGEHQ
jgi:predicted Zn-dependent peptidase